MGGLQGQEFVDGLGAAIFGAFFQVFTEQDEGDNDRGRLKIIVRVVLIVLMIGGLEVVKGNLIGRIQEGSGCGDGHQGIHVGLFVFEFFKGGGIEVATRKQNYGEG